VRELKIQKITTAKGQSTLDNILELNREQAGKLVSTIKLLDHLPIEGGERTVVDDDVLQAVMDDPQGLLDLYRRDKERLRELIQNDASAKDLIALAFRRDQVTRFRSLLDDHDLFEAEASRLRGLARPA
jgi:hypothetical protein